MKDPAFLFYSGDFMTGTMFFTDTQTGQYIKLLCAQHLTGHLEEEHMLNICKIQDPKIWAKFKKDSAGLFYNEVLEGHIQKRKDYAESRRQNRLKYNKKTETQPVKTKKEGENISLSYDNHMENVNENENVIVNKDISVNKIEINFSKTKKRLVIFQAEVLKFSDSYTEDMLTAFAAYWTETNPTKTKMRFEMEKTFEIKKRLVTWENNNNKFGDVKTGKVGPKSKQGAAEDRLNDVLNEYNDKD